MERRKFVIGAGALATGSAAAIGSGAFTSVEANRDVTIDVADDSDAFLALTAPAGGDNTEYAETGGDVIALDISGDADRTGQSGEEGLNKEATTTFLQLFKVENQGTNTVGIGMNNFDDAFESMGWFVGDSHNAQNDTSLSHTDIKDYDWENPGHDLRILAPGEDVWVGAYFLDPDFEDSETYTLEIEARDEDSAIAAGN